MDAMFFYVILLLCSMQIVWFLPILNEGVSHSVLEEKDFAIKSKIKQIDKNKEKSKQLPIKIEFEDSDSMEDDGSAYIVKASANSKECQVPLNITFCQCNIPEGCDYADGHKSHCNSTECSCNNCHKPCCCKECHKPCDCNNCHKPCCCNNCYKPCCCNTSHKTCCCYPNLSYNCMPCCQVTPINCIASVCSCQQNTELGDCLCEHGCMCIQPFGVPQQPINPQQLICSPYCMHNKMQNYPCTCHYFPKDHPCSCLCNNPHNRYPEPTKTTFPTPRPLGWKPQSKCDCKQRKGCSLCCKPCYRDKVSGELMNNTANVVVCENKFCNNDTSDLINKTEQMEVGNLNSPFEVPQNNVLIMCCYNPDKDENPEPFDSTFNNTSILSNSTSILSNEPTVVNLPLFTNATAQVIKNQEESTNFNDPTFVVGK